MGLSVGIVGLPNAGKSTLFNALTRAGALVASYPFTTVEPNTGIVPVPDQRLDQLNAAFKPRKVVPATVTFTDIAGLVRGAHRGEGLGNQFLRHIRESDAIAMVVRAFQDPDVAHVEATLDPVRDIDLLELELALADLETVSRRHERVEKTARLTKDHDTETVGVLRRVHAHLDSGAPVRTLGLSDIEGERVRDLFLLTAKPILVMANVDEADVAGGGPQFAAVAERARRSGGEAIAISARIESEIVELGPEDQRAFLESLGLEESGLPRLIHAAYRLLSLITFFSVNENELHAWTLRAGRTALDAAAAIHTDFARGFIRAEVVPAPVLAAAGSFAAVREQGKLRLEGRDYVVHDGDVVHIRFNV